MITKLRHWKHADAGWFREMDNICFPPPDTSFINNAKYHWWVYRKGEETLGYAGLYLYNLKDGTREAYFARAGVLPAYRGRGIQSALINARLAWLKKNSIKTARTYAHVSNVYSIKNLREAGFKGRHAEGRTIIRFSKEIL